MSIYKNSNFENTTIILDGNSYDECIFKNCTLTYSGESYVSFNNCKFFSVNWNLVDAAGRTADFIRALYNGLGSDGKNLINTFLNNPGSSQTPSSKDIRPKKEES